MNFKPYGINEKICYLENLNLSNIFIFSKITGTHSEKMKSKIWQVYFKKKLNQI